ncbi:elongation of fatty acids protein 3-like [Tripterygium wilfordii]|uniref:elongation of fatty acids protein 3-like n=1 Tax=Tripterygium wilfordii TaxID=458696 RepID=UPI0018F7FD83|nr:elongation of fatty acids protein 3-like [Tripterygium wilfordii]
MSIYFNLSLLFPLQPPNSTAEIGPMSHPILSTLQYWLVSHPKILHFSWNPGQTTASTPLFLTLALLTYLSLTLLLPRIHLPSLDPHILKPITAVHSLTLFLLSFVMCLGCTLSIMTTHEPRHTICFPHRTLPTGPLFFWAYIFYLSKILEFVDTLLIILAKSSRRLTFLHVYHHATVLVMSYFWLQTSQSLFPVGIVTNSLVHVFMYCYYLLSAMGVRPKWKRLVTDCQIVQFVFGFAISGLMLYYHFTGLGCSGMLGWGFSTVFGASLLLLFVDFHSKTYAKRRAGDKDKRL